MLNLNLEVLKSDESETVCNGKIYRCRDSHYVDKKGSIVYKTTFRLMKSLSCKGCEHCGFLDEEINETLDAGIVVKDIIDGRLYMLQHTNISRDWETGFADDWDLELVLLPEEYEKGAD